MTQHRDWLDGPKLVTWLEETGILTCPTVQLGEDECRIRRWRDGCAASYYAADRILCKLGVCIGELPEDFYRERPENGRRAPIDAATKKRMVRLYRKHGNFAAVARVVGRGEKTVARYVREAMA